MDNVKSMLEHYWTLNQTQTAAGPDLDVLKKQIAPLLDRTGKLMADMAHCVKPPSDSVMLMPT